MRSIVHYFFLPPAGANPPKRVKRGFTLIELLITITVLAILIIVIVVFIDPAEIFKKARDTRRIADLQAIRSAMTFALASGATIDLDGSNTNTCAGETGEGVYVSVPATTTMHSAPAGWAWKQAAQAALTNTDGSGWIPINFSTLPGGSPLFNLPVDPQNVENQSAHFFYSFGCDRTNNKFELNAKLESKTFGPGGDSDKSIQDGGDVPDVYETGTAPNILPTSGVY